MTITDKLLFLHLHKSGGTFVNFLLLRCIPSARQIGYHLPYRELPSAYRHLPVLGTVRNPWAYYVSWYHFQAGRPRPNILFQVCSDGGRLGFNDTIANLVRLSSDDTRLALLEDRLPHTFQHTGLNLTKTCIGELRRGKLGFYSFLYERLYAGTSQVRIMRTERLREELRETLAAFGHLPNPCAESFLNEVPPLNVSQHESPGTYYDESLAALVAEWDRTLVDRYGYTL